MDYASIKADLGVTSLDLSYDRDEDGKRLINPDTKEEYPWVSSFNNNKRVRILMHDNVACAIRDGSPTNLAIKTSEKKTDKGAYTEHIIIQYTPVTIDFAL